MAKRESNAQRTAREYERRSPSISSNFQPIEVLETKVDYAKFYSRSHEAVIRVYDAADNAIETHEHKGDFKDW